MKVAFDTATLLLALSPNPGTVLDRNKKVIPDAKQRVEYLIEELSVSRTQVIIPTPVFSEILVRAENAASKYFEIIRTSKAFRLEPFDARAAIEAAMMMRSAVQSGRGKRGGSTDPWPKVKYDRQIVAIAKVCGVQRIYSQDEGVIAIAHAAGIPHVEVAGLLTTSGSKSKLIPKEGTKDRALGPPLPVCLLNVDTGGVLLKARIWSWSQLPPNPFANRPLNL